MRKTKLVVLSVSAGAGHVRAAQALCAEAERSLPGVSATHIDVMELVPEAFCALYTQSYLKIVARAPLLWAYLYQRTDERRPASKADAVRRAIERLNTRKLDKTLADLAPDAIICTHFLPAELLSRRIGKRRPTPPVWVQITDFDVHGLWLHPHLQGYCVANDEIAARLIAKGMPATSVHVTGIPIMPAFSTAPTRTIAAKELGLSPDKLTLLMMSGGAGVGGIDALARELVTSTHDLQVIALAGRNQSLLEKLQALARAHPGRLTPMGFTTTIERVMAAADVAITKPGGLTSAECLALNLPMIVISPIPGQEERNADFLLESGVAMKAVDSAALRYKVDVLARDRGIVARMRERTRAVARPAAAAEVLGRVIAHLESRA
jgi:processive 1,2-diacylglycerol beta-glucosyltransferase